MTTAKWNCKKEEKMTFLNIKNGKEQSRENSFFELAVKNQDNITSYGYPSVISNLVYLVFCYGTNQRSDAQKGKCKDISEGWYYGVVWTDNYEFAFAVQKNGASEFIFGDKASQTIDLMRGTNQLKDAIKSGKLYKAMNLGDNRKWIDWANGISRGGEYGNMRTGFKFSKEEGGNEEHKCNNKKITNFLENCDWSLIDVSRYTGMKV